LQIPLGWTVEDDNNDGKVWKTINNPQQTDIAHSGTGAVHMAFNFSIAMDDWLFTPPLQLEGGQTYKLDFWYHVMEAFGTIYPEKLEVKWGTAPTAEAMTSSQLFNTDNMVNTNYMNSVSEFTPATDGVYYIGFHGYSDAFMNLLIVDDIRIDKENAIGDDLPKVFA